MTPGERDQRLSGIACAVAQDLWGHSIGQRAQLLSQRATLVEEPPVEITVGEEPEERLRLSGHAAEPLPPGECQEPGRRKQQKEPQERSEACEPPDEPAFDTPEERIDDEADRHLVSRFLLEGSAEPRHDLSRHPVGHGVTCDPPARQREAERQPQHVGRDVEDHEAGGVRLAKLLARDPDLVEVTSIPLDPATQFGHELWLALAEIARCPHDPPLPRQRLLRDLVPRRTRLTTTRRLLPPRAFEDREQAERVVVLSLD